MPRLPRWLMLVTLLAAAAPARAEAPFKDWTEFFAAFKSWSLDSTRIAEVHSLMIERDAGTFVLEEGRLAFAKPFAGRQVAAMFVGRGTFRFAPASQVEREQLERTYKTKVFRRRFEHLTLIVSDSTFAELLPVLQFHTDTLGALRKAWNTTFSYLTARKLHYARPLPAVQMLLDGADNGFFWGLMNDRKNEDPIFFALVPEYAERVLLERKPEGDRRGLFRQYNSERVSMLFAAGDPDTLRRNIRPGYEAVHYSTDLTLASDLTCTAVADIDLLAHGLPRAWIGFDFPEELVVDEVSMGGRPQNYFREDENPMMWVRLDHAIPPESTATLRVRYHGELFERSDDWVVHKFSTGWYPEPWYGSDATWDMTFHSPRDIQLLGCGTRTSFRQEKLVNHSTWRIAYPLPWASFTVNFLRGTRVTGDSLPPLTVWMRHLDGAGRVEDATFAELKDAKDYDRRVALDVARAFQFYRQHLGEPLATEFNAVETPSWVYEAYPGLVHMMLREDKLLPGPEYTPDLIRAHELSHQWFGLSVFPATYHDQWLSEGFADFCSIWYLQASRKDSKNYFKVLDAWRERLLTNRKFMFGTGQEAGPIWLGTRTSSSTTEGDYSLVVYAKGAWVLHMLRNYLLDLNDPSEARFRGLMRDFYQRYRGRRVFTEEFRAAVERAAGEDMGWFFAQWVYGTEVPAFRFTWTAEPAGTQWRVKCRIERSKVPDSFRCPLLVRVDFPGDKFSRQRVWSEGPVTEFELPLAPEKPLSVDFNDLHSVLCEELK
jgi:hypothetical protein